MKIEQDFAEVYGRLATQGCCDAPGGGEYRRVLHEWLQAGRPDDVERFILLRANLSPDEEG